jgi:23S rRNA A2030 N6-methylase RlmJ
LRIELMRRRPTDPETLNGCGLVVANPPQTLHGELASILPVLARRLGDGAGARFVLAPLSAGDRGAVRRSATPRLGKRTGA